MSLQYMLIPTVGVHKGTTGTMENNPIIEQWIPTYNAIHLPSPAISTLNTKVPIIAHRESFSKPSAATILDIMAIFGPFPKDFGGKAQIPPS
jgi:hypothetical protein